MPRTELMADVFVFVVAAVASLITWGLGLVVGGLLAREVPHQARERGPTLHFPMLAIAGPKMRDILGYTTIVLIASGLVFGATLVIVSL